MVQVNINKAFEAYYMVGGCQVYNLDNHFPTNNGIKLIFIYQVSFCT